MHSQQHDSYKNQPATFENLINAGVLFKNITEDEAAEKLKSNMTGHSTKPQFILYTHRDSKKDWINVFTIDDDEELLPGFTPQKNGHYSNYKKTTDHFGYPMDEKITVKKHLEKIAQGIKKFLANEKSQKKEPQDRGKIVSRALGQPPSEACRDQPMPSVAASSNNENDLPVIKRDSPLLQQTDQQNQSSGSQITSNGFHNGSPSNNNPPQSTQNPSNGFGFSGNPFNSSSNNGSSSFNFSPAPQTNQQNQNSGRSNIPANQLSNGFSVNNNPTQSRSNLLSTESFGNPSHNNPFFNFPGSQTAQPNNAFNNGFDNRFFANNNSHQPNSFNATSSNQSLLDRFWEGRLTFPDEHSDFSSPPITPNNHSSSLTPEEIDRRWKKSFEDLQNTPSVQSSTVHLHGPTKVPLFNESEDPIEAQIDWMLGEPKNDEGYTF